MNYGLDALIALVAMECRLENNIYGSGVPYALVDNVGVQ